MASHLQMKRGRLSWLPLFPYWRLLGAARPCTQMAGYIEDAETPDTPYTPGVEPPLWETGFRSTNAAICRFRS